MLPSILLDILSKNVYISKQFIVIGVGERSVVELIGMGWVKVYRQISIMDCFSLNYSLIWHLITSVIY